MSKLNDTALPAPVQLIDRQMVVAIAPNSLGKYSGDVDWHNGILWISPSVSASERGRVLSGLITKAQELLRISVSPKSECLTPKQRRKYDDDFDAACAKIMAA